MSSPLRQAPHPYRGPAERSTRLRNLHERQTNRAGVISCSTPANSRGRACQPSPRRGERYRRAWPACHPEIIRGISRRLRESRRIPRFARDDSGRVRRAGTITGVASLPPCIDQLCGRRVRTRAELQRRGRRGRNPGGHEGTARIIRPAKDNAARRGRLLAQYRRRRRCLWLFAGAVLYYPGIRRCPSDRHLGDERAGHRRRPHRRPGPAPTSARQRGSIAATGRMMGSA